MDDDWFRPIWAGNIAEARKQAGLTQKEAGERCGVDQTTFSRWERGKLLPTDENKGVIAKVFGREPNEMFSLERPTPAAV